MTTSQKVEIIAILQNAIGDDLERAKIAFRGLTTAEMQMEYGESGQTRQQILDGYVKHRNRIQSLIQAVKDA